MRRAEARRLDTSSLVWYVVAALLASYVVGCKTDLTFNAPLPQDRPYDELSERSVLHCAPGHVTYDFDEQCFGGASCDPVEVELELPCTETSGVGGSLQQLEIELIDDSGVVVESLHRVRSLSQVFGGSEKTTLSAPLTLSVQEAWDWALVSGLGELPDEARGAFRVSVQGVDENGQALLLYPPVVVSAVLTIKRGGVVEPPSCVPDCGGVECGTDGCGGSCGDCQGYDTCQGGICVSALCGDGACGPGETSATCCADCGCAAGLQCQGGACECVPLCGGSECGPDGCGGSCGECPAGQTCSDGECACQPTCSPAACGPNGCGGTCGGCVEGAQCRVGSCVEFSGGCQRDCQGMVEVPGGWSSMGCVDEACGGDEGPVHDVWLAPFFIDATEVTAGEYAECKGEGACAAPQQGGKCTFGAPGLEDHPVNCVTYAQASQYCSWAGKRLPTEAEWEKAASGGSGRAFPWGSEKPTCENGLASFGKCGDATVPVGSTAGGASEWGAQDLAGNVSEWVLDWYGPYSPAAQVGPPGPPHGSYRVIRGGGWSDEASDLRTTHRDFNVPEAATVTLGFRCAL